jgi:hypothetical protein
MSKQHAATATLSTNAAHHPAVVAWKQLDERNARPTTVQTMKRNVFRLVGAGPGRINVVAKKCSNDNKVEKHVYEDGSPRLAISSPSYYGHINELNGDGSWLFIEDAGDERYSPRSNEHQILVTKWLAELHTSESRLRKPRFLPDRGVGWFLERPRSIRSSIQELRSTRVHLGDDVFVFVRIVSRCDTLESRWHEVESTFERVPSTLVHCDSMPQNICLSDMAATSPSNWQKWRCRGNCSGKS